METGFLDVCNTVLKFKDFKDALVRRTVINLIPELAKYNPGDFINYYLHRAMVHLLGLVQIDRERPTATKEMERSLAFMAIGKVALVVKQGMDFFLDDIMFAIKDGLHAKRYCCLRSILFCITLITKLTRRVFLLASLK